MLNTSETQQKVHRHIESLLGKLERPAVWPFSAPYLVVSASNYAGNLYTWDHYHMALRFAAGGRPEYLRFLCENVLGWQESDGFAPSCILVGRGPRGSASRFHAQPYLARAAAAYLELSGDAAWAGAIWSKLAAYLEYYEREHAAPTGLHRWAASFHSGLDNDVVTTFHQPETVVSCDLSSLLVLEFRAAARMAEILDHADAASDWQGRARALTTRIRTQLWLESAETFAAWDLVHQRHCFGIEGGSPEAEWGRCAYQTCSNLFPLYAGIAEASQAERMIRRYVLAPEHFLSDFGIRSLSRSSEFYNNAVWGNPPRYGDHRRPTNSNWQGPVWIPLCYFMVRALRRYGFESQAEDLRVRTLRVLSESLDRLGSFAENFCGETGRPLYARDFGAWNLLADVMDQELPFEFPGAGQPSL